VNRRKHGFSVGTLSNDPLNPGVPDKVNPAIDGAKRNVVSSHADFAQESMGACGSREDHGQLGRKLTIQIQNG
jgi:hypothetical protein